MTRVKAVIDAFEPVDAMGRQRQEIASELAGDIDRYNDLLDASKQRINTALAASATTLTTINGVGPICAAMIIGESGSIDRFKPKHHFASYNATAPVVASSGPKGPASAQPARQPEAELGAPRRRDLTTRPRTPWAESSTTANSPRARPPKKQSGL